MARLRCDERANYMTLRELQRYVVQVPKKVFMRNLHRTIELIGDQFAVLISPELHYSDELGLILERGEFEPDQFLI